MCPALGRVGEIEIDDSLYQELGKVLDAGDA